jgi:peptidoglycan/xylan/chitin deacetylase (PgdA/CDA1 family)
MSVSAYLTIDDSPTYETDQMVDFLLAREIPAVLFCIGDAYTDLHLQCQGMTQLPGPIIRAIEKGFVIGNHTYTHRRSSELSFEDIVEEIEKTEKIIDDFYRRSGRTRTHKLIRFPHLDRGAGGWIVDYDAAGVHGDTLKRLFSDGLNISLKTPDPEQVEKKQKIQDYLKREGFTADIYPGVSFPWYTDTEMATARDSLYTFSTSDWMLNPDFAHHAAAWPYRTLEALKDKIDMHLSPDRPDPNGHTHIVLAHDHNKLFPVLSALIDHMLGRGVRFIPVAA